MTMTFLRPSTPSISARSCGTMVVSTSEEMPEPRVRNSASISSKKTTTGTSSAAFSRALTKISRILRSVSPTYLLSSSGPLMLRKKPLTFSPRFSEIFCGEVVGDGLGDHGLAAAGRAVEQHALGRREVVLLVVVGVEVGQLDGVLDGLDLGGRGRRCPRSRCRGLPRARGPRPRSWAASRAGSRSCRP